MATEIKVEMSSHAGPIMMMPMGMGHATPIHPPPIPMGMGMSTPTHPPSSSPSATNGHYSQSMHTPQSAMGKASQTPSPSASTSGISLNASASKRPARKSTLTQQQKNQKRQRATQDQLTTLEVEFNKNPTPNADTRVIIADQINMTERSVQIWFQNR